MNRGYITENGRDRLDSEVPDPRALESKEKEAMIVLLMNLWMKEEDDEGQEGRMI